MTESRLFHSLKVSATDMGGDNYLIKGMFFYESNDPKSPSLFLGMQDNSLQPRVYTVFVENKQGYQKSFLLKNKIVVQDLNRFERTTFNKEISTPLRERAEQLRKGILQKTATSVGFKDITNVLSKNP